MFRPNQIQKLHGVTYFAARSISLVGARLNLQRCAAPNVIEVRLFVVYFIVNVIPA
jgi:hypothetical protein